MQGYVRSSATPCCGACRHATQPIPPSSQPSTRHPSHIPSRPSRLSMHHQQLPHTPSYSAAISAAGPQLSLSVPMLSRYIEQLKGVVLAFSDLKLLSQSGIVMGDQPDIHLDVSLTALLFSPAVGQRLGRVQLHTCQATQHIHSACDSLASAHSPIAHVRQSASLLVWRATMSLCWSMAHSMPLSGRHKTITAVQRAVLRSARESVSSCRASQ